MRYFVAGLLLLLALVFPTSVYGQWSNGYQYKGTYVIQPGQMTGTQSNFTVVAAGTIADYKTAANGGKIQNTCTQTLYTLTRPADIIFTDDSAGTNVLSFQFDFYTAATGAYSVHVKMPNADTSTHNTLYVWYDKSSQTTCLGGSASGAWDTNTKLAMVLPNITNGLTSDYIGNTITNTNVTQTTGLNSGMANLNGTNAYLDLGASSNVKPQTGTVEFWTTPANGQSGGPRLFSDLDATAQNGWEILWSAASNQFQFQWLNGGGGANQNTSGTHGGVQSYVAVASDNSTGNANIYVNGASEATITTASIGTATVNTSLGRWPGANTAFYGGTMAEFVISSVVRSSNWIVARYNNINAPNTFFTVTTGLTPGLTLVASPTGVAASQTNPVVITLTGTATTFTSDTVTISGVSGVTCTGSSPCTFTTSSNTVGTITLNSIGSTTGTLTISVSGTDSISTTITIGLTSGGVCATAGASGQ